MIHNLNNHNQYWKISMYPGLKEWKSAWIEEENRGPCESGSRTDIGEASSKVCKKHGSSWVRQPLWNAMMTPHEVLVIHYFFLTPNLPCFPIIRILDGIANLFSSVSTQSLVSPPFNLPSEIATSKTFTLPVLR